ncbi:MAG: Gfo/Idh/MocA family protein [Longimicrobiales bacterium]
MNRPDAARVSTLPAEAGDAAPLAEVKIGLLGTGAIAQVVHLPTLGQMPGVGVAAVCDADPAKARAIGSRFEIPRVYRADDDLVRDPDLEGVIICTPSYLHEQQSIAALEAGKHVLVEKPLALTADGARRVLTAAEASGRAVMVAMNNRYRPDCRAVRPFATNGELGRVFYMRAGLLNRKVRTVRPTWRHRRATAGGGALMDLGVQVLDLCMWMLDYPRVNRLVAHLHPGEGIEVEDAAAVMAEIDGGLVLSLQVTWSLIAERDRQYLQLLGTHGSASLVPLAVNKEIEHGVLDVTPQIPPGRANMYTASYRDQLAHFTGVIRGTDDAPLPTEQIQLMEFISLAYRSGHERREIVA